MDYKIIYKTSVEKDFGKIEKADIKKIFKAIDTRIKINPLHGKPLKGEFKGLYRYRTGDYRILYSIFGNEILILRIGNRKDIYR